MIFENLIEPRGTLFAAIQVNRCWAEECCRVLWGLDEPDGSNYVSTCMMTLAKLLPARQQHYANMISCLVLVGAECFQAASETTHVHFPNLRDLRIYGVEEPFQKPLSLTLNQFLQPNLRFLILSLDRSSENFFELLETRCPNLDHFQILNMSCCPREPFLGFLERVQRLRTIRTWQGKPWLNDELFVGLVTCKTLTSFESEYKIKPSIIHLLRPLDGQILINITRLRLRGFSAALLPLISGATKVKSLTLTLHDIEPPIMDTISSMLQLDFLELRWLGETNPPKTEIFRLRRPNGLKCLTLQHLFNTVFVVDQDHWTERETEEFLASFPRLEELKLLIRGVSDDVVARYCREKMLGLKRMETHGHEFTRP